MAEYSPEQIQQFIDKWKGKTQSTYNDEDIKELRARWIGKEILIAEIIKILKGEGKGIGEIYFTEREEEAKRRMNSANELLIKHSFPELGIERHLIYSIDLPCLDLRGIDLSFKNCEKVFLNKAHLEGADLSEAYLEGAYLTRAHLEGAKLFGAHLEWANLYQAHLEGADLRWAHLEGAKLIEAHLEWAYLQRSYLEGAYLNEAHLEGAKLFEAHLEGADLTSAHLEGAKLFEAHLEGANLFGAHLEGADFGWAHLEGADLTRAHLEGADFSRAYLGELKEFSPECNLNEERKEELLQGAPTTAFDNNSFLPRWRDHFRGKCEIWEFIKGIFKKLPDDEKNFKGFIKNNIKNNFQNNPFFKHIFNRWNYINFEGVNIDLAETTMAKDLYRYVQDQQYIARFKATHKWMYRGWKLFSDCGGKLHLVGFWALVLIALFAGLYANLPLTAPAWIEPYLPGWLLLQDKPIDPKLFYPNLSKIFESPAGSFWNWIFISFDIFTNLGIRGTYPQNWLGVLLILSETLAGFLMLGMLISVMGERFARRS